MTMLLLDEKPLVILPKLAVAIGLNEAIILQQVNYWLKEAATNDKLGREKDDRTWIYNNYDTWQAQNFPFWSVSTIKRTVYSLEEKKLLITELEENPNYAGGKRKWYTIDYDNLSQLGCVQNEPRGRVKMNRGSCQNDTSYNKDTETTSETTTEDNTTGAKSAPDAGHFPEGTIGFDEMLESLDLTQADIDATPLDELIDDPVDDVDLRALHDASEWHEDLATVDDPGPVPDDFKAIQEHTVNTVFDGNTAMFGKAGDIANWALRRNSKPQWIDYPPERAFVMFEWGAFLEWYACLDIEWPSSADKWNKWAFKWRASPEYRQLMKPRRTEPPLTDAIRMANVHELMTPFPTGGDE